AERPKRPGGPAPAPRRSRPPRLRLSRRRSPSGIPRHATGKHHCHPPGPRLMVRSSDIWIADRGDGPATTQERSATVSADEGTAGQTSATPDITQDERELAHLGYKQELSRAFSSF